MSSTIFCMVSSITFNISFSSHTVIFTTLLRTCRIHKTMFRAANTRKNSPPPEYNYDSDYYIKLQYLKRSLPNFNVCIYFYFLLDTSTFLVLIQTIRRLIWNPFFILLFNKITEINGGVSGWKMVSVLGTRVFPRFSLTWG